MVCIPGGNGHNGNGHNKKQPIGGHPAAPLAELISGWSFDKLAGGSAGKPAGKPADEPVTNKLAEAMLAAASPTGAEKEEHDKMARKLQGAYDRVPGMQQRLYSEADELGMDKLTDAGEDCLETLSMALEHLRSKASCQAADCVAIAVGKALSGGINSGGIKGLPEEVVESLKKLKFHLEELGEKTGTALIIAYRMGAIDGCKHAKGEGE